MYLWKTGCGFEMCGNSSESHFNELIYISDWMGGWMDGWMDGWTDGRTNGRTDERTDGWMHGWTNGWDGMGWMDNLVT
jgi:hypothetical protein